MNPEPDDSFEDHSTKATEEMGEESYTRPREFRQLPKQKGRPYGKPDATSSKRRPGNSGAMEYYTDLYSAKKDVEMILPKEKSIILPMVNGKPKPYQGYRAAPDSMPYGSDDGDVIYGKPNKGVGSVRSYRIKRSPTEYHGGIYPHFDYTDLENSRVSHTSKEETDTDKNSHKKRGYPKKYRSKSTGKPNNHYKYPKGNRRTNKRSSAEQSEGDYDEEEEEEDDDKMPPYKYNYDSSIVIPQLNINYYPYETQLKRGQESIKEEGTEDEEPYESKIDEYTAGYEAYKKSLPSDLESYFGKPDFGDFTVEATENLEENKNCEKVTRQDQAAENATEEASKKNEICYICRDPKTGGSFEQCAYQSQPKSEKYFYGGTTSFHTEESPEPINYRYRRSTFGQDFDLDRFVFGREFDGPRKTRQNEERSPYDKPRKKHRKNRKHHQDEYPYGSYNGEDHYGSPSARRSKSKNKEGPPDSYNGPRYTYEGPKHPYEGPEETYEGPINKDYYITTDDRIENEDENDEVPQVNEESQSQPKKEYYEYNTYHPPDRRYSPSSRRSKYASEPRGDREEEEDEGYGPETSYTADYRFGPEHFVDDEAEEERPRQKSEGRSARPPEKRQKHSGSESRPAPSTEEKGKDSGNVKVFKNGDVCRKKKVDGMICMVCKNEKTAATYEQCQYSSKPKDKYYAYGSQKSYRTSDPDPERKGGGDEEDQRPEKSDVIEKKILITKQSKVFQDNSGPLDSMPNARSFQDDLLGSPSDNLETHLVNPNDTNRQVTESIMRMEPRDGIEGLEEYLYSDSEDSEKKATDEDREYRSYDDYIHDIFPEFMQKKGSSPYSEELKDSDEDDEAEESEESESERHDSFDPFSNIRKFKDSNPSFLGDYSMEEEESREASNEEPLRLKDQKSRLPDDFFLDDGEDYHKKDIEKAVGEFQSRDWSNCKKIVKDKLTCYQCVDKNGVNNEECMYVEASQPLNEHMAYHERKELKPEGIKEEVTEPTHTEPPPATETRTMARRMRRPKNAKPSEEEEAQTLAKESRRRPIGDYKGVPRAPEVVMTPVPSLTTEYVAENTTEKPLLRTMKRNQKRIKTSKKSVEATTERARKRKYPAKNQKSDDTGNTGDANESVKNSSGEAADAMQPVTSDAHVKNV